MNVLEPTTINHFVSEQDKAGDKWRIAAYNYYFNKCSSSDDVNFINSIRDLLFGVIDNNDYKYFVNPYNFVNPNHTNLPGKLRNYDIITPIFRRYLGEYISSANIFHIVSKTPDEENTYQKQLTDYFNRLISDKVDAKLNEAGLSSGNPNAKDIDVDRAFQEFKTKFKDAKVIRDSTLLDYVKASTDDEYMYGILYSDWILYSRYFVDRGVRHNDIFKERIDPLSARFCSNGKEFVEDWEAFWYETSYDLPTLLNVFKDELTEKDVKYLTELNNNDGSMSYNTYSQLIHGLYIEEVCKNILNVDNSVPHYRGLFPVGKLYFKGFKQVSILKYKDMFDNEQMMEVNNDYTLDTEHGDIELTKEYYPTVYVMYNIGNRKNGIFTKPKEVEIQRNKLDDLRSVKLPVTGKVNIANSLPDHSIVRISKPHQLLYNLLFLARERAVSKNHGKIAVIPKGLLGQDDMSIEDNMYYMLADGKLLLDTSMPAAATYVNALKELNLSDSEYIKTLSELIEETKMAAMDACDMNRQRFGETYASDGKANNEQALIRSSLGTAFINFVFNFSRAKDYNADIDFTKFAFIDGKKAKFVNGEGADAVLEIEGVGHANTEYNVYCVSGAKYNQQLQSLKDIAFSASQNGQTGLAAEAVINEDITKLKNILDRYEDNQMQQAKRNEEIQQQMADARNQLEAQYKEKEMALKDALNLRDNQTKLQVKDIDYMIAELKSTDNDKDREMLDSLERVKAYINSRKQNAGM